MYVCVRKRACVCVRMYVCLCVCVCACVCVTDCPILCLLQQLVCHSQHTYFYCQAVLQSMDSSAELRDFQQWLREEMQKEAQIR